MVYTPGQPRDPHQPRPAVVLSLDVRNRFRDDLIVVPMFSRGAVGPTRLQIPAGEGGLRRTGVVFCEEITTIDREFLARGPLGPPLGTPLLDALVRAVRRAVGDFVREPAAER